MRSTKKSSTRGSVSSSSPRPTDQSAHSEAPARRTPPANAFSALYLSKTLGAEEPPFARQAMATGSCHVEKVPAMVPESFEHHVRLELRTTSGDVPLPHDLASRPGT
jgi:hypothetical protein